MAKRKREKIKLESSAGTGHFYTTTKNRVNTPNKLEFKKSDPFVRKQVLYNGTQLKAETQVKNPRTRKLVREGACG